MTIPRGVVDPPLVDLEKLPAHVLRNQPMRVRNEELNYGVGYQPFTVGDSHERFVEFILANIRF